METKPQNIAENKVSRERKLSRWIITLLIFASTVMVAQGVYNLSNLKEVDESIDAVYKTANQLDTLARDVTRPIADIRILSQQLVLSPNATIVADTEAQLNKTIPLVQERLTIVKKRIYSDPKFIRYQENFSEVEKSWNNYLEALKVTQKYQKSGIRVAAFISVTQQEKLAYEQVQSSVSDFSKFLLTQSRTVYEEANDKSNLAYITLFITVVVEILILKFILYFVWRMFRSFIASTSAYEDELQKERQQLLNTLNASPVGVGVTVDSKLIYVNEKLESLLGVKVGDSIKESYVDIKERENLVKKLEQDNIVSNFNVQMHAGSGDVLDMINTFYKMEYDEKPAILAWLIDVSNLKKVERKNLEAKQLAEEATQAKSDFLANMSHEIRTPMNAIIGLSELALETDLNAKQYNYINKVHRSAESLLGIINDILDFSKIEAGKLTMEKIDFKLENVLENLGNLLSFKAEEKQLELLFDIPNELPQALIGDPLRLGQILVNLGNNAVKFTEQGEVVIKVSILHQTPKHVELFFEVTDSGIGISPNKLTTLFDSFTQADTSTTREFGGTGLGLTISKNLAEMMGGNITCQSTLGKGSTFSFNTKFEISHAIIDRPSIKNVKPMRVLIVDDNDSSREIIGGMLHHIGLRVEQASSGQNALDIIKNADQDGVPYDLVMMDWKMPNLDGISTTRLIQNDSNLSHPPTVIMVTAYGRESAMEAANDVNIKGFLTKPVTHSTLLDAILITQGQEGLITNHMARKAEEVDEALRKIRGAKLLLAEDNEINMELAIDILERHHIKVITAVDGREAIEKLAEEEVDGILMDCQMPIMDGYKATREIRSMPQYKDLPIMAMTANAMVGDKEKVILAGMNDHIAKPIQRRELFLTIAKWVTPKNPLTEIEQPIQYLTDEKLPPIVGIDIEEGMKICDHNAKLYKKLLNKFAEKEVRFTDRFLQSMKDHDKTAPTRCAHTLKGVASNIAAFDVQQAAAQLEQFCKDTQGSGKAFSALTIVQEKLDEVIKGIQQANFTPNAQTAKATNAKPLPDLLKELIHEAENYDTQAIEILSQIKQSYFEGNKEIIEKITKDIEIFNFEEAQELAQQWLKKIVN